MSEIRDYHEHYDADVAEWSKAVSVALSTAEAQQQQARRWVEGGFEAEGFVVTPGPADARRSSRTGVSVPPPARNPRIPGV
jgi:hypothetical protein